MSAFHTTTVCKAGACKQEGVLRTRWVFQCWYNVSNERGLAMDAVENILLCNKITVDMLIGDLGILPELNMAASLVH